MLVHRCLEMISPLARLGSKRSPFRWRGPEIPNPLDIFAEVSTESATSTLLQYAQIAGSLGIDDYAKGIFLIRNGEVLRMVGRDLEKYAGVGTALVILASGVEKARTNPRQVATFLLLRILWRRRCSFFSRSRWLDEAQGGKIISGSLAEPDEPANILPGRVAPAPDLREEPRVFWICE